MRRSHVHHLLAVAVAAALLLPGCDIMGAPAPLKPAENVGVDPTGETLDTSTLPPDAPLSEDEPVASAPRRQYTPADEPTRQSSPPLEKTYVPPSTSTPGRRVRVGTAGMVHHHRVSSSEQGTGD